MNLPVSGKVKKIRSNNVLQGGSKIKLLHTLPWHYFLQIMIFVYGIPDIKTTSNAVAITKHPASTVGKIFYPPFSLVVRMQHIFKALLKPEKQHLLTDDSTIDSKAFELLLVSLYGCIITSSSWLPVVIVHLCETEIVNISNQNSWLETSLDR